MSKVLPALVGISMLSVVGTANAAEPVTLTDAQMDGVTAGQVQAGPRIGPFLHIDPTGGWVTAIQMIPVVLEALQEQQTANELEALKSYIGALKSLTPEKIKALSKEDQQKLKTVLQQSKAKLMKLEQRQQTLKEQRQPAPKPMLVAKTPSATPAPNTPPTSITPQFVTMKLGG